MFRPCERWIHLEVWEVVVASRESFGDNAIEVILVPASALAECALICHILDTPGHSGGELRPLLEH